MVSADTQRAFPLERIPYLIFAGSRENTRLKRLVGSQDQEKIHPEEDDLNLPISWSEQ